MSQVLVSESSLADIGAAIRGKNGSTDTYLPSEMGPAIEALEDPSVLTTKAITANGSYDAADDEADGYSVVTVNVPNSYEAADEGKVVSSGVLVAQTSTTVTQNGTVDTTLNDEVIVNVPSQAPTLVSKTITQNGTYDPEDDSADGYSEVTVNVSGGGGAKNILSGTTTPTASDGEDGDIYLLYAEGSIKNTSGQYINTSYSGNATSKYVIDFMLTKAQGYGWAVPFGGRTGDVADASLFSLAINSSDFSQSSAQWGTDAIIPTGFQGASGLVGKRVHVELEAGHTTMTVDGTTLEKSWTPTGVTSTSPIGIFAALKNGAYQSWSPVDGMMLFGFEIYEGETLVHSFVPALDTNDVACVYDEVADEYKYNSGGGTFEYIDEGEIIGTYLKVNGSWVPIEGQDIDDVDTEGSGGSLFDELAVVIDNPNNASKSFQVGAAGTEVPSSASVESGTLSYVFLYADNQTTSMTIGENVYPSSDLRSWSATGDNAFIIADSTAFADGSVNLAMNSGDSGNHACTLVGYTGKTLAYSQSAYLQSGVSVVTDKSLPNAYVVFLFSVYYGGATATVDFMGESLTVPRYTDRYSNSTYYMIRKVSDVASGTTISAQIQGVSASNVIGMLGVFE